MRVALLIAEFVVAAAFIVGLLWSVDIIDLQKGQQFRLAERFVDNGSVFKKFNSISVFPNEIQQSVYLKINAPLKEQFKPDHSYFRLPAKDRSDTITTSKQLPWDKLISKSSSLQKLEGCNVLNQQNWMCTGTVEIFTRQLTKFGKIDGDWIYFFGPTKHEFHDTEVYSSKIKWFVDRRKCGSLCFIGDVEQLREKRNALENQLRSYIKRE